MKFSSTKNFSFPSNLVSILKAKEYFEDDRFDPILISVQEDIYEGKEIISYQIEFEVLEEFEDIDGDLWEKLIRKYIQKEEPQLLKYINGDSEISTCAIWTDNQSMFLNILIKVLELVGNKSEIHKIKNEISS